MPPAEGRRGLALTLEGDKTHVTDKEGRIVLELVKKKKKEEEKNERLRGKNLMLNDLEKDVFIFMRGKYTMNLKHLIASNVSITLSLISLKTIGK